MILLIYDFGITRLKKDYSIDYYYKSPEFY
jgi:hypothetical protein